MPADMASLPQLPVELIELIARNLVDTPNLSALRLTCRDIYSKSFDYFGKEYFTRKQFMLSEFSLQTLVDISAHKILSRYVRRVIIGTDHLILRPVPNPHDATGPSRTERYNQLLLDQRYMKTHSLDLPMLIKAFTNLRGACQEIEFRNYNQYRKRDKKHWHSYGAHTIEAETGVVPQLEVIYSDTEQALSRTFSILLSAIQASKLEIRTLLVTLRPIDFNPVGLQEHAFHIPTGVRPQFEAALSKITFITLSYDADHRAAHQAVVMKSMCSFLSSLPSLHHLRLNAIYSRECGSMLDLSTVNLPNLENLELGYMYLEEDTVVETIARFPRLRHLGLFRTLLVAGTWKQALQRLAKLQIVRSLTAMSIREDRANQYNVGFKKDPAATTSDYRDLEGTNRPISFLFSGSGSDPGTWMQSLKDRIVVADRQFFGQRNEDEDDDDHDDNDDNEEEEDDHDAGDEGENDDQEPNPDEAEDMDASENVDMADTNNGENA